MGNVKEVILDCSLPNAEYADPHILEASRDDIVKFTARNSTFEVLIHNRDRFFDCEDDVLKYYINQDESQLAPSINGTLAEGHKKYYSAHCLLNHDDTDQKLASPPRIIINPGS